MKAQRNIQLLARKAFVLLMGLMFSAFCRAEEYAPKHDFEVDGVYYRYAEDGQSVAVTYRNTSYNRTFVNIYSYGAGYSGDVVVPEQVTWQDVTYPVTAVDQYAFVHCDGMTSVQLPSTIRSIGRNAFSWCTGLTSLTLPDSLTSIGDEAFSGCKNITELVVRGDVQTIGQSVFASCEKLTSVTLPSGITSIGDGAFDHCYMLETVCFSGQTAEAGKLVIPDGVTYIGNNAFSCNRKLKSVVIPESVRRIGSSAFSPSIISNADIRCNLAEIEDSGEYLNFVNIGKDIFSWYNYSNEKELTLRLPDYYSALSLCLNNSIGGNYSNGIHLYADGNLITEYTIPENFWDIPDDSFDGITDMKSVTLPSNLQFIGSSAFKDCKALESVNCTNADALTTIKEFAFEGCSSLKEFTFGTNIKEIGRAAFNNCSNLEKVDIGDLANWCDMDFQGDFYTTKVIPSNPLCYAKRIFLKGKELNELSIPTTVKTIRKNAFCNVQRFDKLTIPRTLTTIEDKAFAFCEDLDTIIFKNGTTLETLGEGVFQGCKGLKNVTLPNSITQMGNNMFRDCSNLESVTLQDSLTEIPSGTFYECTSLNSITLPEKLTTIRGYAFYHCKSLQRIAIPATVNLIGPDAFHWCTGLTGVYITDLAAWCRIDMPGQDQGGGWAVRYNDNNPLLSAHNLYLNNELVTDLVIPEGVESVADWAFAGATCLKSVTIPEGCKKLGGAAFWDCSELEAIHIPASMEAFEEVTGRDYTSIPPFKGTMNASINLYIEDLEAWTTGLGGRFQLKDDYSSRYVYLYVKGEPVEHLIIPESVTTMNASFLSFAFTSVTLPAGLSSVPNNAFNYCSKLKYLYSRSRFVPKGTPAYYTDRWTVNSSLQAVYVPKGRVESYKSSWTKIADLIVEAPESINLSGNVSAQSLTEEVDAHNNVYDDTTPYLDLTDATLDETVTADVLQGIADEGTVVFLPDSTEGIEGTNIVADGRTLKLILRDSTDFVAPYDFTADELLYRRKFAATESAPSVNLSARRMKTAGAASSATTLCLPFSLSELPEGMKAFALKERDESGNAVFDEVFTLEANMPYLVTLTSDIDSLQFKNVLVKATPAEMPYTSCDGLEFHGTLSDISHDDAASEEAYVLGTDLEWFSVYDADEEVYVPAGHAYLLPTDYSITGNIATGIAEIMNEGKTVNSKSSNSKCYDLSGRRMSKPQNKGIYILKNGGAASGGRKVLVQ